MSCKATLSKAWMIGSKESINESGESSDSDGATLCNTRSVDQNEGQEKDRDHATVINWMIPREHTCGGQQFGRAIAECSLCNTVMVCIIHGPEGLYTCCHSSVDPVMGSNVHSAAVCISVGHTTHSGRGMNVSASTVAASWNKPAPNCVDCGIKKLSAHRTLRRRPNLYRVYQRIITKQPRLLSTK